MNSEISGINKIKVVALENSANGKKVNISNGSYTLEATIADKKAEFLIPSIPAPARKDFTITFGDFRKTVNVGYGDVTTVYLAEGYDPVKGIDLLDLDEIMTEDLEYKAASAEAVKDLATAVSNALVTEDSQGNTVSFQFGIDSAGRYGYKKAGADSVIPFKDGSESFCYYLGTTSSNLTTRKFDIETVCNNIRKQQGIIIDPAELTVDNFVCMPTKGTTAAGYWDTKLSTGVNAYNSALGSYRPPKLSYENNKLTVSDSLLSGMLKSLESGVIVASSEALYIPLQVYLIKTATL